MLRGLRIDMINPQRVELARSPKYRYTGIVSSAFHFVVDSFDLYTVLSCHRTKR